MNASSSSASRGQILPIFAGGLLALLLVLGLVIDGGSAMAHQRETQNGADAAAHAGTVVIAQYMMMGSSSTGATGVCPVPGGDAWDREVCRAIHGVAEVNGITIAAAHYTDYKGAVIGSVGDGFPTDGTGVGIAQGIQVSADQVFDTYFARIAGLSQFKASAQATAVTGTITALCLPGQPCSLFPMTVPFETSTCDNSGKLVPGSGPWPYLGDADTVPENMAIIPLCENQDEDIGGGSAGSVGWLDYSTALGVTTSGTCPNTFKDAVLSPCVVSLEFPTWVQTFSGGVGKGGGDIQEVLNSRQGDIVQIPLFDGTCKVRPTGTDKADCPDGQDGVGVNTWYHIPSFASFELDLFYISGNDRKECDKAPGSPFVSGNGANGCVKGWWVIALPGPGAINLGPVSPSPTNRLGVQLIK